MRRHWTFVTLFASVVLTTATASAQVPARARQASYSADQAEAGAAVYREACAACHLPNLRGSFEAPELAGVNFRNTWGARSVSDLVVLMRETMPTGAPGSLDESQYVALAAFMLRENGVAPAQARLSLSSSGRVIGGTGPVATGGDVDLPVRPPVPGRVGTGPTPGTRNSVPEVAEFAETATGITRTYRAPRSFTPASDTDLASPPDGDWLHWRGTPGAQGYSPLGHINTGNVHRLGLAWVWGMEPGTSQPSFLVRDGVIFLPNQANVIQALDASDGTLLWEYRRKFPEGFGIGRGAPEEPRPVAGPHLRGNVGRQPRGPRRSHGCCPLGNRRRGPQPRLLQQLGTDRGRRKGHQRHQRLHAPQRAELFHHRS